MPTRGTEACEDAEPAVKVCLASGGGQKRWPERWPRILHARFRSASAPTTTIMARLPGPEAESAGAVPQHFSGEVRNESPYDARVGVASGGEQPSGGPSAGTGRPGASEAPPDRRGRLCRAGDEPASDECPA